MADPSPVPDFDRLMRHADPAMVVVTVAVADDRDGCLVGFHSQAGIEPLRYVVWLSLVNHTTALALDAQATHLAVHLLAASDHDLARHFGGVTADDPSVDKFAGLPWSSGPGGVPLLEALPDRFVGRILERTPVGGADHVAIVLEPVESAAGAGASEPPLRLHQATDIEAGHPA